MKWKRGCYFIHDPFILVDVVLCCWSIALCGGDETQSLENRSRFSKQTHIQMNESLVFRGGERDDAGSKESRIWRPVGQRTHSNGVQQSLTLHLLFTQGDPFISDEGIVIILFLANHAHGISDSRLQIDYVRFGLVTRSAAKSAFFFESPRRRADEDEWCPFKSVSKCLIGRSYRFISKAHFPISSPMRFFCPFRICKLHFESQYQILSQWTSSALSFIISKADFPFRTDKLLPQKVFFSIGTINTRNLQENFFRSSLGTFQLHIRFFVLLPKKKSDKKAN